jgi:hypothetical protein
MKLCTIFDQQITVLKKRNDHFKGEYNGLIFGFFQNKF